MCRVNDVLCDKLDYFAHSHSYDWKVIVLV